jgi:hypothetical protein
VAILGQAYSFLGFKILDGVVGPASRKSYRTRPCSPRSNAKAPGFRPGPRREHVPPHARMSAPAEQAGGGR